MGPDDIIRSPHAKAPLRALPAAPPSPLLDIKTKPASYLATHSPGSRPYALYPTRNPARGESTPMKT